MVTSRNSSCAFGPVRGEHIGGFSSRYCRVPVLVQRPEVGKVRVGSCRCSGSMLPAFVSILKLRPYGRFGKHSVLHRGRPEGFMVNRCVKPKYPSVLGQQV